MASPSYNSNLNTIPTTTTTTTTTTAATALSETKEPPLPIRPRSKSQSQKPTTTNNCISLRQDGSPVSLSATRPRVNSNRGGSATTTTTTTTATNSPTIRNTNVRSGNDAASVNATTTTTNAVVYSTVHIDKAKTITITTSSSSESADKSLVTDTPPTRRRLPLTPHSQSPTPVLDNHNLQQQQQQQYKYKLSDNNNDKKNNNSSRTENRPTPNPRPRTSYNTTKHKPNINNTSVHIKSHSHSTTSSLTTTTTTKVTQKEGKTISENSSSPGKQTPIPRPRSVKNSGISTSVPITKVRLKLDNSGDLVTSEGKVNCAEDINFKQADSSQVSNSSRYRNNNSIAFGSSSGSDNNTISRSALTNSTKTLRKSASQSVLISESVEFIPQDESLSHNFTNNRNRSNSSDKNNKYITGSNTSRSSSDKNDNKSFPNKVNTRFVRSSTCGALNLNHNSKSPFKTKGSTSNNHLVSSSITDRPFTRKGSSSQIENDKSKIEEVTTFNTESSFGLYDEDFRKATSSASAVCSQLLGVGSSERRIRSPADRDKVSDFSSDGAGVGINGKQHRSQNINFGYKLGYDATSDNSSSRSGVKKIRFYITDDDDEDNDDDGEEVFSEDDRNENGSNLLRGDGYNYHANVKRHSRAFSCNRSKHSSSSFDSSSRHDEERSRSHQSREEEITLTDLALRRMSATELPPIADNLAASSMGKGRNDKRKTSTNSITSNGSKNSSNQLPAAVNGKTVHNRKTSSNINNSTPDNHKKNNNNNDTNNNVNTTKTMKKKKSLIPRNHSDSSLKGLIARNNSSLSQASNYDKDGIGAGTGNGTTTASPGGTGGTSSGGAPPPPAGSNLSRTNPKFLNKGSRALSWCATDNSGSQSKLETLFEGQNINNVNNGSSSNLVNSNSSLSINMPHCNSSGNLVLNGGGSGNDDLTMPSIHPLPDRCVSVNGIRSREEVMRLQASNRKLMSEAGDVEISTLDDFIDRGRMRRSQSDNKLLGNHLHNSSNSLNSGGYGGGGGAGYNFNNSYSSNGNKNNFNSESNNNNDNNNVSSRNNNNANSNNVKNSTSNETKTKNSTGRARQSRTMSRNLSVDRIDRLTSKPARRTSTSSRTGVPHSHSRMRRVNSVSALNTPKASKGKGNPDNPMYDGDEEEICMEASARLVEWLNEVNNVDEYDTDPKDAVIDYVDEPPQTDTALHVVYNG